MLIFKFNTCIPLSSWKFELVTNECRKWCTVLNKILTKLLWQSYSEFDPTLRMHVTSYHICMCTKAFWAATIFLVRLFCHKLKTVSVSTRPFINKWWFHIYFQSGISLSVLTKQNLLSWSHQLMTVFLLFYLFADKVIKVSHVN